MYTTIPRVTHTRVRVCMRVYVRVRASARTRLACVGERYAVPRGVIRRITTRDTPYLFLDPLPGQEEKGGDLGVKKVTEGEASVERISGFGNDIPQHWVGYRGGL